MPLARADADELAGQFPVGGEVDGLAAARLPGVPDPVSLTWLARHLGLPVYGQHEALGDALTTAQVFLALVTRAERERPQTLGTLTAQAARASQRAWLRRMLRL